MSKLTDILQKALDKKRGTIPRENSDSPVIEKKTGKQRAPTIGKKPPTKSAGRGR